MSAELEKVNLPFCVKLFVKPFQDELQEAISAHAAREQTAEYSDDFDSDEDDMLNGKTELNICPRVLPFFNSLLDHRESL